MTRSTIHDFTFELKGASDKAIKCHDPTIRDKEKQTFWLPLSQIEYVEKKGGIVEVQMPEWLAIEKGLL